MPVSAEATGGVGGLQLDKEGNPCQSSLSGCSEDCVSTVTAYRKCPESDLKIFDLRLEDANAAGRDSLSVFYPSQLLPKQFAIHLRILYMCPEVYVAFN